MLDTKDAVIEALRANDREPYGRQRTIAAEEIAEAAEQFDDQGLLGYALLDLMEAYEYDGEPRKAPVVFARILKLWDEHPDEFNDWARRQVFWRFKWISSALLCVPDVPLAAVHRWHGEMRDRYAAADLGLQPYYAQRFHLAAHAGLDDADDAFDLWATRRRTDYSDCVACEIRSQALHHVQRGDDVRALEAWQPVLDGRRSCAEEPYLSHAHALLPLLRQGRTDQARSSHLVGYRFARGKSNLAREIGLHLEFCALSGNEPRGLEILAENRDLFGGQGDPLALLGFLTGVEVLLSRLSAADHDGIAVSGPPGTNWTVLALLAHVRSEADALAARFDARNGTTAVGDRRRARLAQRPPLAEPLTLGVRAAAGPLPAAPVEALPEAEPVPADLKGLILRARELRTRSHPDATALWRRVGDLLAAEDYVHPDDAELGSRDLLAAEVALQRAFDADDDDRHAEARSELAAAADLFDQAGLPARALATRARVLVQGLDTPEDRADWAALDELLSGVEKLLDSGAEGEEGEESAAESHLTVLQCRAYAAHHELVAALPDPAAELVERFQTAAGTYRREAAEYACPGREATARQYLAHAAARLGRFDEAEAELRGVLDLIGSTELPWYQPRVLGLLSQILLQQGRPADAVPVLHEAIAAATRWRDRSFPFGPTYAMLGHACANAGDPGGAVRALTEAAARFDRAGAAQDAAESRLQLADLLSQLDRVPDAVAVLESVLLDPAAGDLDERLRAQVRLDLARGMFVLGEYLPAAEEFLGLADAVAGWEDQDTHTMVACEATLALAEAGRWEAARTALDRALTSHRTAPRADQVIATLRQFARLTANAEGPAGLGSALERLAEADAVRERAEQNGDPVSTWYQTGSIHHERARAYATADRPEDGLASAESAIAAFEAGGPDGEEPRAESVRIAALIEGGALDRPAAARTRLTDAIGRCERAGLPEAARILAELRDRYPA